MRAWVVIAGPCAPGYRISMTTLHLMVGLPCSGKTTLAKRLESELRALRLTPDEWHRFLYGQDATHPEHDERHSKIETTDYSITPSAQRELRDAAYGCGSTFRSARSPNAVCACLRNSPSARTVLDSPFGARFTCARTNARTLPNVDPHPYARDTGLFQCSLMFGTASPPN